MLLPDVGIVNILLMNVEVMCVFFFIILVKIIEMPLVIEMIYYIHC